MTGSLEAPWSLLRGFVAEGEGLRKHNDKRAVYNFILPAGDYEIQHTWGAASAMRGTGSHGVAADDVFVPEGLAIPLFGGPRATTEEPRDAVAAGRRHAGSLRSDDGRAGSAHA